MTNRKLKDKLTPYRRHAGKCPIQKPLIVTKCECPLWVHGRLAGKRVRFTLDTRSLSIAEIKISDLLHPAPEPPDGGGPRLVGAKLEDKNVEISVAVQEFLDSKKAMAPSTRDNNNLVVGQFLKFTQAHSMILLREITEHTVLAFFAEYANVWNGKSRMQRLSMVRGFLNFCVAKKWLTSSPAGRKNLMTRPPKPPVKAMRQPFSHPQISKILAAVETLTDPAERIRGRAIINLLLFSGQRISDAAFCERASLMKDQTLVYQVIKTGRPIEVAPWLNDRAVKTLKALPPSRTYFFLPDRDDDYWPARHALMTGEKKFQDEFPGGQKAFKRVVRKLSDLVLKILRRAGIREPQRVEEAKSKTGRRRVCSEGVCHRFRDTFAVNLLTEGIDIFTVSQMLGHRDVKITSDHYLKLVDGYQEKLSRKTQALNYPLAG